LSTPSADEVLQASLQHVVATYNPIDGRRIYVNGELVTNTDPVAGGTLVDWQDTFALVLGNEASGDGLWEGTFRLAAVHRRALSLEQVVQNFDAGVGEKFFLLFDISERISAAEDSSYILFQVQQFDNYAYLFEQPHFVTLDGSTPEGIPIRGMRIAMNGREAPVGQTYATLDDELSASEFGELGQPLSVLGAVVPLEKGPENDEFFLTFDRIAGNAFNRAEDPVLVITPTDLAPAARIGVRTFDEINATFASITGVDPLMQYPDGSTPVYDTFTELRQSLPAVEDVNTFLSSHQVAIAQLAIQYCDAAIGTAANPNPDAATYWPEFDFSQAEGDAFSVTNRNKFVDPLVLRAMGQSVTGPNVASQPSYASVYEELASFQAADGRPDNLIDRLLAGSSNTRAIAKGVCAAVLGSAATLASWRPSASRYAAPVCRARIHDGQRLHAGRRRIEPFLEPPGCPRRIIARSQQPVARPVSNRDRRRRQDSLYLLRPGRWREHCRLKCAGRQSRRSERLSEYSRLREDGPARRHGARTQ
jgi:hypothetical protein